MQCVCCKEDARDDWLVRKFRVKLVQRLGMTLLPPSTAEWRYRRGGRSLKENLKKNSTSSMAMEKNSTPSMAMEKNSTPSMAMEKNSTPSMAMNGQCNGDRQPLNDSFAFDVPLREVVFDDFSSKIRREIFQLEQVINFVLINLRDRITEVRWSAAKGIGRVATRLPRILADDVLSSVLNQCFGQLNGHASWHGGCLALAELARRGVLHPDRLPQVVDVILKVTR